MPATKKPHLLKPMTTAKPLGAQARTLPKALPVGQAPAGRPVSNIGRYLIKPTPNTDTGFEMLNSKPDLLKEVERKFLKLGQLPPHLQPKGLVNPRYTDRPDVLEAGRRKGISRGFNKPRSRQG